MPPHRRSARVPFALVAGIPLALVVLACGGDTPTAPVPPPPPPNIAIVAGNKSTDTVQAKLVQALTVEVRVNGVVKPATVVRFDAVPTTDTTRRTEGAVLVARISSNTFSSFSSDSTDAQGRARAMVQLGTIAGTARVAISVPELGYVDTATFTVTPGTATKMILKVRDTTVVFGGSYPIGAAVADKFGNLRAETPSYESVAGGAAVSSAGIVTVGSAVAQGKVAVKSGFGTDTARFTIVPNLTIAAVASTTSGYMTSTVNLDGSRMKTYTLLIGTTTAFPTVSPRTGQVVYQEFEGYYASNLHVVDSTGPKRRLLPSTQMLGSANGRYSADGAYIIFSGQQADTSGQLIWRVRPDGTGLERLTTVAGTSSRYTSQQQPAMSPDGTHFVYVEGGTIWLQQIGSTARTNLGAGNFPVFSGDGQHIAFATTYQAGMMNADGTGRKLIGTVTYNNFSTGFAVTKDGSYLVYRDSGGVKICIVATGEIFPLGGMSRFYQIANGA